MASTDTTKAPDTAGEPDPRRAEPAEIDGKVAEQDAVRGINADYEERLQAVMSEQLENMETLQKERYEDTKGDLARILEKVDN